MFVCLRFTCTILILICSIAFDADHSAAQVLPGLPLPPQHPPQLPDTPPVPGPPTLAPVPLPPQEQERGELPELRVRVKRIETRGNTIFSSMQLREVTQDYENRPLTSEDIEALRTALTMYYINKGYATSGAIIPDQDLDHGLLVVEIIEGQLAGIDVEGNHWFRAGYIRSRVRRGAGPPLNVLQLQEQLQLLQLDQRFTRVTAEWRNTGPAPSTVQVMEMLRP
jgi:hemolysin activation/secretion protein